MKDTLVAQEQASEWRKVKPWIWWAGVLFLGAIGLNILSSIRSASLEMTPLDVSKESVLIIGYVIAFYATAKLVRAFLRFLPEIFRDAIYIVLILGAYTLVLNQLDISKELAPFRRQYKEAAGVDCQVVDANGHTLKCGEKVKATLANRDRWLAEHHAIQIGGWETHAYGVKNDTYEPNLFAVYLVVPFASLFPAP